MKRDDKFTIHTDDHVRVQIIPASLWLTGLSGDGGMMVWQMQDHRPQGTDFRTAQTRFTLEELKALRETITNVIDHQTEEEDGDDSTD
jgi:hypothetical protein